MLSKQPQAMQLRYLQTLANIAGDKSSTIVFPLPIDLLSAMRARGPSPRLPKPGRLASGAPLGGRRARLRHLPPRADAAALVRRPSNRPESRP